MKEIPQELVQLVEERMADTRRVEEPVWEELE